MTAAIAGVVSIIMSGLGTPAEAQSKPSWLVADLLTKAKAESGTVTIYSSVNEAEALPLWKDFEEASGIKVEYVRGSDTALIGRIALEARAKKRAWDVLVTTAVGRLPAAFLAQFEPPEARSWPKDAIGPDKRWYGVYSNICAPAYNTKLVDAKSLPKSFEEMASRKDWAGKVAIDIHDEQWMMGLYQHYGEARAKKVLDDIVTALKPGIVSGHLALARQVGLGEYAVALSNYINLTNNVRMRGSPTDYWVLDPVVVIYGGIGISADAPRPASALLAANFLMSKEGQQKLSHRGRIPVRTDVTPNPPDVFKRLDGHKLVPVNLTGEDEKKASRDFQAIFKPK
jgi:ABC-type Fe3+ transport system substrate-binding protein